MVKSYVGLVEEVLERSLLYFAVALVDTEPA